MHILIFCLIAVECVFCMYMYIDTVMYFDVLCSSHFFFLYYNFILL
jgi:hypothetical protein